MLNNPYAAQNSVEKMFCSIIFLVSKALYLVGSCLVKSQYIRACDIKDIDLMQVDSLPSFASLNGKLLRTDEPATASKRHTTENSSENRSFPQLHRA